MDESVLTLGNEFSGANSFTVLHHTPGTSLSRYVVGSGAKLPNGLRLSRPPATEIASGLGIGTAARDIEFIAVAAR